MRHLVQTFPYHVDPHQEVPTYSMSLWVEIPGDMWKIGLMGMWNYCRVVEHFADARDDRDADFFMTNVDDIHFKHLFLDWVHTFQEIPECLRIYVNPKPESCLIEQLRITQRTAHKELGTANQGFSAYDKMRMPSNLKEVNKFRLETLKDLQKERKHSYET